MIKGLGIVISIFIITLLASIPLGLIIAILRRSKYKLIKFISKLYILVMRGTPLLLQLIVIFYGLPLLGITFDRFTSGIIAFLLNYAAYFAEIYRSGIEAMPKGQYEAAEVLGYSKVQTFFKIIFPQVIKRIIPPITNEVITLVKDTSLAFALAVTEMFTVAKAIAANQKTMTAFIAAAIFYYVFNLLVAFIMEKVEKKLAYYR